MKQVLLTFLSLILFSAISEAADGYRIRVKLEKNTKDTVIYLAHYFGKSLPTIFKQDSARIDKNGVANLVSDKKITGGIYMILPSSKDSYFEMLLDNGDNFSVTADMSKIPESLVFKGTDKNQDFLSYLKFLSSFSKEQGDLQASLSGAKTKEDTTAIYEKMQLKGKELTAFRRTFAKGNPNTLLAQIFNALEIPEVPDGKHLLPDGKTDSFFAYRYYKNHYWDGFNFKDDRLIHAPILDLKLEEYFNKIVFPSADSVIKEADIILAKTRGSDNLFKYTLNWLSTNAQTSKIMGMDEVFVYLVREYYLKGDATWLSGDDLEKYIKRYDDLRLNLVGKPAPEFMMWDTSGKQMPIYDFKAKYTLLIFYATDCGHCIKEIPLIDSVYRAVLKDKGVKIYAANTEKNEVQWHEFIDKHHIRDWTNVWDPNNQSRYWALYDVKTTPSIYLLDEDKVIWGKKLDHTTIAQALEIAERKKKEGKKK